MNIQVIGNRILAKEVKANEYIGNIYIGKKVESQEAKILKLGSGRNEKGVVIPFDVKVGDSVLIEKRCGYKLVVEGEEFLIITEDEILAVIES